jgi:hypothetical protein
MTRKNINIEPLDTDTEKLEKCLNDSTSNEWDIYLMCNPISMKEGPDLFGPINWAWSQEQGTEMREKLRNFLQNFCREMMEVNNNAQEIELSTRVEKKSREQEMRWIENNKDFLETLSSNWIVVEGYQLVAYSKDFSIALTQAKEKGVKVPFVYFIPESKQSETINI